jgi:hypothetical protein
MPKQEPRAEHVEPELGVPLATDADPDLADDVEDGAPASAMKHISSASLDSAYSRGTHGVIG